MLSCKEIKTFKYWTWTGPLARHNDQPIPKIKCERNPFFYTKMGCL